MHPPRQHSGINASSKLGGRDAQEGGMWHRERPSPPGEGYGGRQIFCCDLKMSYFGEFWGAKSFYLSWAEWGLGRFCGKFWILEQNNEQKTSLVWSWGERTTNIGLLYPKVRNNIGGDIPIDDPPTKILEGMCPRHSRRGWRQCTCRPTLYRAVIIIIIILKSYTTYTGKNETWKKWNKKIKYSYSVSMQCYTLARTFTVYIVTTIFDLFNLRLFRVLNKAHPALLLSSSTR